MNSQDFRTPALDKEKDNPVKRRRIGKRQGIQEELKVPSSLSEWRKLYKKCIESTSRHFLRSLCSPIMNCLHAFLGQFTVQWSDDMSTEILPVSRLEPIADYEKVSVGAEVIGRWSKTGGRYHATVLDIKTPSTQETVVGIMSN